ncbi:MAG: FIST N-terminal domain-containing protein [Kofleriaceae bacterium]
MIARNVSARGDQVELVATQLGEKLVAPDLELVVVFADWRLDPRAFVEALQRVLGRVPFVGCTAVGVVGTAGLDGPTTVALGLYGEGLRAGVGVATELGTHTLARSRNAVDRAAHALGLRCDQLDATRHVAFTLVDGSEQIEEAFCIGSAAAAPQIRVVGGGASTELDARGAVPLAPTAIWANGEVMADAGVAVVLELARPFEVVTSCHLVPTDVKTVVTAARGRTIEELDGVPAPRRLGELLGRLGVRFDEHKPTAYSLARVIDGVPYVRSILHVERDRIQLAAGVEPGHVLRIMRPGDLIALTRRDLAAVKDRLGSIDALLAFSCVHRDWEASGRAVAAELAAVYDDYPTTGFQSFGEQTGMLFVNHTLTALAIGGG